MHVQCLAIASASADGRSHNDQLVLCGTISNAALFACGFVARVGLDVEFQGCHERQDEGEEELKCEKHIGGSRQGAVAFGLARVVLAVCDWELSRCLGHAAVGGVKGSLRFGSCSAEREGEGHARLNTLPSSTCTHTHQPISISIHVLDSLHLLLVFYCLLLYPYWVFRNLELIAQSWLLLLTLGPSHLTIRPCYQMGRF
jgi:hypothetical protein